MRGTISRGRARGFTLVELLTVMVVIGLLAAIAMPRFASARFSAELSACQSNLNSIGKAVRMYANDNDQAFPTSLNLLTGTSGSQRAYLPDRLVCPSNGQAYVYNAGSDRSTYTIYCQGNHNVVLPGQVGGAGFPQYQSSNVVLK